MIRSPMLSYACLLGIVCIPLIDHPVARADSPSNEANISAETGSADELFREARTLYRDGPEQADVIIQKLQAALEINPKHEDAAALLAIVYYGTGRFKEALAAVDKADRINQEIARFNPRLKVLQARCLGSLGQFNEGRNLLIAIDAFVTSSNDPAHIDEVENLKAEMSRAYYLEIDPIGHAALRRATELGVDPSPFLIAVVNSRSNPDILDDSDIKPYVPGIAFDNDLWAVVFIPNGGSSESRLTLLIDKAGKPYGTCLFGQPKLAGEGETGGFMLKPVDVLTDRNTQHMAYSIVKSD